MTRTPHGPDCYACADPAAAAKQIAGQRAELETEADSARLHRQWGEWIRGKFYLLAAADDHEEFTLIQGLMLHHLGAANAIASGVQVERAHLDRVEAAHDVVRAAQDRGES